MASVRKRSWVLPGGRRREAWCVEYTDREGERRRDTPKSGLKRDAEKLRIKIENEVERGVHVANSQTITLSAMIDRWLEKCEKRVAAGDGLKRLTLKNWRVIVNKHVRPHLGRTLVAKITAAGIQKWLEELAYDAEKPVQRPTLRHAYNVLRYILSDARAQGFVVENVMVDARIRIPGKPTAPIAIPTKAQARQIVEASKEMVQGGAAPYIRPAVHIALFAGLRLGEIRALHWEDVDLAGGLIKVRRGMDPWGTIGEPKSASGVRDIPIPANLSTELKRWHLASGRPESGLVLTGRVKGVWVKESAISISWRRLQHRALGGEVMPCGTPRGLFHFHALRHVYASLLIESGLPAKRVQYLMGHASIKMTFDRYGHLFEDAETVRAAIARVGADIAV